MDDGHCGFVARYLNDTNALWMEGGQEVRLGLHVGFDLGLGLGLGFRSGSVEGALLDT